MFKLNLEVLRGPDWRGVLRVKLDVAVDFPRVHAFVRERRRRAETGRIDDIVRLEQLQVGVIILILVDVGDGRKGSRRFDAGSSRGVIVEDGLGGGVGIVGRRLVGTLRGRGGLRCVTDSVLPRSALISR